MFAGDCALPALIAAADWPMARPTLSNSRHPLLYSTQALSHLPTSHSASRLVGWQHYCGAARSAPCLCHARPACPFARVLFLTPSASTCTCMHACHSFCRRAGSIALPSRNAQSRMLLAAPPSMHTSAQLDSSSAAPWIISMTHSLLVPRLSICVKKHNHIFVAVTTDRTVPGCCCRLSSATRDALSAYITNGGPACLLQS